MKIFKRILIAFFCIVIVLLLIALCATSFPSGNQYRASDERLQVLENTELRPVNGKKHFGKAWMEKRGNFYVLHLEGSPYEIGYQHGMLLKEEIVKGVVPIYADPVHHGREKGFSLTSWLVQRYLNWEVFRTLEKHQPRELREELKGIADGAGISYEIVFKANNDTALSMYFMPRLVQSELAKLKAMGIDPGSGACSSFAATGKATAGGKILVGRNTDYHGMEGWPKYQTVMFVEPEKGFRHVKVGTAGLIMWNPGMNEKGIVLCSHRMFYDDMTPEGWNIAAFTDAILRTADSLEKAREILKGNLRGASCGFVVIDGKTRNAFAAEVSTGSVTFREMVRGSVVMTNMAMSEEKQKIDLVVRYRLNEGVPGRQWRLQQLIDEHYGKIDTQLAAAFMGDHIQYVTGIERGIFGIVGVTNNVNSMVFSPEDLKLWIADGPAPVCNNPYIGFDLNVELQGKRSSLTPSILAGYQFKNPKKRQGMELYNQAYALYDRDPEKVDEILSMLLKAVELDPGEPIYYRMIAKFLIHKGSYDEALAAVEKALPIKQSLNEKAHNNLLMGILYDLKGVREKALVHYRAVDQLMRLKPDDIFGVNRVLWVFMKKYEKSPFTKEQLGDVPVAIGFAQDTGVE